jgi:hypothetical protein
MELELNVRIEKDLPPVVDGAVSFETGATREQLNDPAIVAYEHHGEGFTTSDQGALSAFFEDLLLGRPMPLVLATPRIQDVDTLVAISLFLHRDLATHPNMPAFVYVTDFVHRMGLPALAHLDDHLARFFSALRAYFPDKGLSQRETSKRLQNALGWVRQYIHEESIPLVGSPPEVRIQVIDRGSNGFVVAEGTGPLLDGWVELYRQGHLRGLLVGPALNDRRQALVARKSLFLPFNLEMAARIFNQMESAMGEDPAWSMAPNGLWLEGPKEGTLILVQDLLKVLTRV